MFGDVAFEASADYGDSEPIEAQLEALASLVEAGKVGRSRARHPAPR